MKLAIMHLVVRAFGPESRTPSTGFVPSHCPARQGAVSIGGRGWPRWRCGQSHWRAGLAPRFASWQLHACPFRQVAVSVGKNTHFPRELDPFTPIHLAGGREWRDEKSLDCRALLALRQLTRSAEGASRASELLETRLRKSQQSCGTEFHH